MKNKNFILRTLTCVVGIPILACVVFLFQQYNFIGLRALLVLAALLGSIEMSKMLFRKVTFLSLTSWLMPLLCIFRPEYAELLLTLLVVLSLVSEIKGGESDNFERSTERIGKNLLLVLYPSYLLTFPIRFTALEITNSHLICFYIVLVFANDIFAYIFGSIFGKNNNANLKASPKKSYAGFIGGFVCTICLSLTFTSIFSERVSFFNNLCFRIMTPIIISLFADLGDLAESVIKRSSNVKDSSNLIPGHGGVLDRLDSIVATAPVFFFFVKVFV